MRDMMETRFLFSDSQHHLNCISNTASERVRLYCSLWAVSQENSVIVGGNPTNENLFQRGLVKRTSTQQRV